MILTGQQIHAEVENGNIVITPYDADFLNPNSYNFRLGQKIMMYDVSPDAIDTKQKTPTKEIILSSDGFVLQPNNFYLGHTLEVMGSSCHVPLIGGRSSTGRLGLFIHITAPLGDIGYVGQWTLQFRATVPVRVYPNQKVGQIVFVKSFGEIQPYAGKYQNGIGPQPYNPGGLFSDMDEKNRYNGC